jgi:N-methylhydantoinase B
MSAVDPISSAVVRAALLSTAREVFRSFERTAMHPTIYEAHDYSVSIFDDRLNLVADAAGLPEFVGSLAFAVEHIARHYADRGGFAEGDVVIANDPFETGAHPPDIAVVAPAVADGMLLGFCAVRAHMGDLGAKDPYPCDSRTLYEEGLLFPATKIVEAGQTQDTIYRILAANSRMPRETVGNLRSAVGAAAHGAEKLAEIVADHGIDSYRSAIRELLDRGEHEVRSVLERIPDGEYRAEAWLEPEGGREEPTPLRCKVVIQGSDMTVDVSESGGPQPGPFNAALAQTISACRLALKRLTTQDELTANSGEHRPLSVIAPEGSIYNAIRPAPSFMMHTATSLLSEMVVSAVTPAMLHKAPAPSAGHTTGFSSGLELDGRWLEFDDLVPIGYGATATQDGADALQHFCIAGIRLGEAEPWEARAPVVKQAVELVRDSGGAGRRRGGLGARVVWRFEIEPRLNVQAQKVMRHELHGLAGGMPGGGSNAAEIRSSDGRVLRVGMHSDVPIARGDLVVLNGAGGGGYGDPLEREPERVELDVIDGYVSIEAARDRYGVVIDKGSLRVDRAATKGERERRRTLQASDGRRGDGDGPGPSSRESNVGNAP